MFEALLEPGDPVDEPASPSGGCGSSTGPTGRPRLIRAPLDGVVAVTKAIPVTEQGDCVFVLGAADRPRRAARCSRGSSA